MLASQAQRGDRSTLHSFDSRRKNNSRIFGDGVDNSFEFFEKLECNEIIT